MSILKIKKYCIRCDGCGVEEVWSNEDIKGALRDEGWILVPNPPNMKGMDTHYCPDCKREAEESMMKKYPIHIIKKRGEKWED